MPRTTDEILEHADQLATRFEDHLPDPTQLVEGSALVAVGDAVRQRANAERQVLDAVLEARVEGHSWSAIGAMLGTSGEAARQKYRDADVSAVIRSLPMRRMAEANWVDLKVGRAQVESAVRDILVPDGDWVGAAARRSNKGSTFSPEQLAWLARAWMLAKELPAPRPYDPEILAELAASLVHLSVSEELTREVPQRLAAAGVRTVLLRPLERSKIDGATFWLDDSSPVVVLGLRYDRIDHFYFTLLHELGHIVLGHSRPGEPTLDEDSDLTAYPEEEADRLAAQWALPGTPSRLPSRLTEIVQLAQKINVAPGVIVGRQHYLKSVTGVGLPYNRHRNTLTPVRHIFEDITW